MSSSTGRFNLYHFDPSMAAAVVFLALFAASTIIHMYQMLRTRTWMMAALVCGGVFETVGYIGRIIGSQETPAWSLGPYIIQSLFILIAPALFAATIYMELARVILLTEGERHSLIAKRWLTKVFVLGDIISFMVQSTGGSVQASRKPNSMEFGKWITLGGLSIQVVWFGLFMVVAVVFNVRMNRDPTSRGLNPAVPWRKHLTALYVGSVLIMVRSIFRVVEYAQGFDGYLLGHEVYLYVFDAVLMLAVMLMSNILHPSEVNAMLKGGHYTAWSIFLVKYTKAFVDQNDDKDIGLDSHLVKRRASGFEQEAS